MKNISSIAINARVLLKDKLEGIGWYQYELIRRWVKNHPKVTFHLLLDRNQEFLIEAPNVQNHIIPPPTRHPLLWVLWFEYSAKKKIKQLAPDIFFSPDGQIPLGLNTPTVATIHDINFEKRPQDVPPIFRWYYQKYFPKFAEQAEHIVTVSEFSKQEIAGTYKVSPEKITAVYNGVHGDFSPLSSQQITHTKTKYSNGASYILHVGAILPRKNIDGLLHAYRIFRDTQTSNHKLVIVGQKKWWPKHMQDIISNHPFAQDIIFTGRVPQQDLQLLTGSASLLCLPSHYEGFGLPIVEAFKSGVPVVTSKNSALQEVGKDAPIYIAPEQPESIAKAISELISSESVRKEHIAKGLQRGQDFNWDKTAAKTWDVLSQVVNKS